MENVNLQLRSRLKRVLVSAFNTLLHAISFLRGSRLDGSSSFDYVLSFQNLKEKKKKKRILRFLENQLLIPGFSEKYSIKIFFCDNLIVKKKSYRKKLRSLNYEEIYLVWVTFFNWNDLKSKKEEQSVECLTEDVEWGSRLIWTYART